MPSAARARLLSSTITSRRPTPLPGSMLPSVSRPSAIISPTILVIAAGVSLMLSERRLRDMLPRSCRMRSAALRFVRLTPIMLSPSNGMVLTPFPLVFQRPGRTRCSWW